jgi:serine/threonine-protein kinase
MKSGDVVGGKYRVTERLGAGGMGAVWEAINERTGRKVALKLILHPTDDLRQRLRREAQACGRIAHRNIVQVYDVDETSTGDPFLVMQLLTGQTLADLLASRRRLEPSLVARIGRDIASALSAAHTAKIIHRDLKPANIFLHREEDEDGEDGFVVKVVDFGVSKMLASADGPATITGALVGSPAYMSPEQVRMSKDLDHRTDIWSLGIVLYEMLTGKRPFAGSVEDVIRKILVAPIQPPSHHVRQLSREFDEIVALCLERDLVKRIQSAADLARMLDAVKDQRVLVTAPVNASLDGARPALSSGPDAIQPPSSRRPALGSVPESADDSDFAATVPLQKRAAPAAGAEGGPDGTRILSPEEPIASPMPEWRRAVAARRQATPMMAAAPSEEVQQGGTMALVPEAVAQMAAAMPGTGVTTTTAPLVQGAASAGRAPAGAAEGAAPARRSHGRFAVQIGVGVAVVVAVVVFVATRFVSAAAPEGAAPEVAPGVEGPPAAVVPAPTPIEMPQPTTAPAPTAAPESMATPTAPKVSQKAPSVVRSPQAPKSSPRVTPLPATTTTNKAPTNKAAPAPASTSKAAQLPPCVGPMKTNCRPVYAPKKT